MKSEDVVCYDYTLLNGLIHKLRFYEIWLENERYVYFIIFHKI